MSKIKPIIKINNKSSLSSWVIEKFPENYEQMKYVEIFLGNGSVLLNKNKSIEEVANDKDIKLINIWRSLRDENKLLKSKLKKVKYSEKTFNLLKNKKEDKDYLKQSIIEICLRKMSKFGFKESYNILDRKKSHFLWKNMIEEISIISERVKDVYFLNKNPIEIINSFNDSNTLCFCCPPCINDESSMKVDDHIELGEKLNSYRGKSIVLTSNSPLYRRMFASWKPIKRKNLSGQITKDLIYINY